MIAKANDVLLQSMPRSLQSKLMVPELIDKDSRGNHGLINSMFWPEEATVINSIPSGDVLRGMYQWILRYSKNGMYSSAILKPSDWSEEKHGAFVELGVGDVYREESYLTALISCWICIFPLTIREIGLIRLGTFVIASLIAEGIRVCLVVPMLASIYHGLNGISNSSQLAKHSTSFALEKQHIFTDDHSLSSFKFNYFMNLQLTYLSLRRENLYVVEINSPHKFARQFGFCQALPGEHSEELPASILEWMYQLYRSCTHVGTKSEVSIPALLRNFGDHFTRQYSTWWAQLYDDYFTNGPKTLTELFLSSVNDPADASVVGSKVDAEAIAMDEGTSSQKRCTRQEFQDETPTDDHSSGHPSK
ncbi:hypothetical protein ACH5RR_015371 [Cinchona calisaya]|uniref:Aminotransferase-like plant mobile domain-containing protein n=1 Tax=Cinchona calisaya TaxID=153742 RepID=A0ABD2ZSZ1_9GENT